MFNHRTNLPTKDKPKLLYTHCRKSPLKEDSLSTYTKDKMASLKVSILRDFTVYDN